MRGICPQHCLNSIVEWMLVLVLKAFAYNCDQGITAKENIAYGEYWVCTIQAYSRHRSAI